MRVTERYIDEFLRFCDEDAGTTDVTLLGEEHIKAYAEKQRKVPAMKETTRQKIREVLKWFDWLTEQEVIGRNCAQSLDIAKLIP